MKILFKNYILAESILIVLSLISFSDYYVLFSNRSTETNQKNHKLESDEDNQKFLRKLHTLDSLLTMEQALYEKAANNYKKWYDAVRRNYEQLSEFTDNRSRQLNLDNDFYTKWAESSSAIAKNGQKIISDTTAYLTLSKDISAKKKATLEDLRNLASKCSGMMQFEFSGIRYSVFIADKKNHNISIHLIDTTKSKYLTFEKLKSQLIKKGKEPLMITNAGMFHKDFNPVGLYKDEEHTYQKNLDTSSISMEDNFHLYPNGVFCIDTADKYHVLATSKFKEHYSKNLGLLKIATQSGPMLVIDSMIHPKFSSRSQNIQIRSGVGVIPNNNKAVFIATSSPESFYCFSILFRDVFSCENALYLDGAISKMYLPGRKPNEYNGNFGPMIAVTKRR